MRHMFNSIQFTLPLEFEKYNSFNFPLYFELIGRKNMRNQIIITLSFIKIFQKVWDIFK